MIRVLVRILWIIAGLITSWIVAREALNFSIIQLVVTVLLFTLIVAIAAFWPVIKEWFQKK